MTALMVRTVAGRYRQADRHEVLQVAARYLVAEARGAQLGNPTAVKDFLRVALAGRETEAFACVWLDARHRVLEMDVLFEGTIDGAAVYPRVVVKKALERNAAAVILAHNHPSGSPDPSSADERITQRLKEALALIDVRVLDHLIVTREGFTSFSERGLL